MKMKCVFSLLLLLALAYLPEGRNCSPKRLKLAYFCEQAGNKTQVDKPPVILLHGLLSFKEIWIPLVTVIAMETGRKVCAADLRNHGDSPWSNETDTATMATDLGLLMETLNVSKITLLGHSLGGKVAIDFALKNPEEVEKLIVEDMRPNGISEEARKTVLENEGFLLHALSVIPDGATEIEARREVFEHVVFMMALINLEFDINEEIAKYVPIKCSDGKCRWKANVDLLKTVMKNMDKYMPESTGKFEKPTMFIYGGKSAFKICDVKDEILKLFPHVKFVEVKRAGHIVNIYPEYKESVINFLNED